MRLRQHALALAALLLSASAGAQQTPAAAPGDARPPSVDAGRAMVNEARAFAEREEWFRIPATPAPTRGARTVAAGERVAGSIAVVGGPLEVFGAIEGSAVVYGGDLIVRPGGSIGGDAVVVPGRVRLLGGTVGGEVRSVRGSLEAVPTAAPSPLGTVRGQVGFVAGWFTVLAVMGVGVLVFAGGPLEGVVERLERGFGAALLAGVAGQLALAPVLVLLIAALAATILGVLLIPFAVVGYVMAAAGLMTLGFLAVARIIGGALSGGRSARLTARGAALRGLVVGIMLFVALWLVAALLAPVPLAATVARGIAFAVTWVAMSAGFGAALLSRAGTRRTIARPQLEVEPEEELSWQTPTPIGGVVAARRPTSGVR